MRVLLDTHLLIWSVAGSRRVPRTAATIAADPDNQVLFSAISIAEAAIKFALRRPDFTVDPRVLRRALRDTGFEELPPSGEHALELANLPTIHKDPFDRLLVAQARSEGVLLLTSDPAVARYGSPARLV